MTGCCMLFFFLSLSASNASCQFVFSQAVSPAQCRPACEGFFFFFFFILLFNEGKGSDLSNASQIAVAIDTRKLRHRCFPLITEADFDCLFENTFHTRVMITISYRYNFLAKFSLPFFRYALSPFLRLDNASFI